MVGCEYSGIVRDAFIAKGHQALSCDLLPTEKEGPHYQGDIRDILDDNWDLMIAHPPCTHLAVSGARWFKDKKVEQEEALDFVRLLMKANIPHICIENPISIISSKIRKPDQIIQPWMFGHPEQKATCLWLKNLPPLHSTNDVREELLKLTNKERQRVHYMSPGPDRWKERSRTLTGIGEAMADQWTHFLLQEEINRSGLKFKEVRSEYTVDGTKAKKCPMCGYVWTELQLDFPNPRGTTKLCPDCNITEAELIDTMEDPTRGRRIYHNVSE